MVYFFSIQRKRSQRHCGVFTTKKKKKNIKSSDGLHYCVYTVQKYSVLVCIKDVATDPKPKSSYSHGTEFPKTLLQTFGHMIIMYAVYCWRMHGGKV